MQSFSVDELILLLLTQEWIEQYGGNQLAATITVQLLLGRKCTCGLGSRMTCLVCTTVSRSERFFSSVEVFNVNTGCWEQRTTRGTPPQGARGYSCVAVRNDLYYFGGECGDSGHQNSVHTLNTSTLQWRMLAATTSENGGTNEEESLWSCALH